MSLFKFFLQEIILLVLVKLFRNFANNYMITCFLVVIYSGCVADLPNSVFRRTILA